MNVCVCVCERERERERERKRERERDFDSLWVCAKTLAFFLACVSSVKSLDLT
jgi:hypothetical protein